MAKVPVSPGLYFLGGDPAEMDQSEVPVQTVPLGVVAVAVAVVDVCLGYALEDGLAPGFRPDVSADRMESFAVCAYAEGVGAHGEAGTQPGEQVCLGEVPGGVGSGGAGGGESSAGLVVAEKI